jgi:primosomal replication protein N
MSTIHIPGRCVRLPRGQKSHNQRHCRKGETWREGYDRQVKVTKKTLKNIEKGMKSEIKGVVARQMLRQCSDSDIAAAMNVCLTKFIDPVEEHIKRNKEYEVDAYPSEKTLQLIQRKIQIGTECVVKALSGCNGDKDQIRILVADYVTNKLSVPSVVSEMQKQLVDTRASKLNSFEEWVRNNRGISASAGGYLSTANM